jgi:argininosuccinate lyase
MIQLREFRTPYPNPNDYGDWRACAGVKESGERGAINREVGHDMRRYGNRLRYCSRTDMAWVVCLHRAEVIDRRTAATLLRALQELLSSDEHGRGGEVSLIPKLDGNEDLGSLINLGRTMQEPMSRLQLRDQMIDFFGHYFEFLDAIAAFVERNADSIMPGHTHFSQANPITLANYYLSIFDNMHRGLEQLELSYRLVDRNSGGCGATSGTAWPVDRHFLTRLLGFDQLLEVTYDCEASQDHTLHLLFSLGNILTTLSKATMDIEIWGLEEIDMIRVDPTLAGASSMMPQKSHNGAYPECLRNDICGVLGTMIEGAFRTKSEPHGDVMGMLSLPDRGRSALASAKAIVRNFAVMLSKLHPQKDKMLEHVRRGYSCMTEVVVHMVRELGYGGRRSHRICAHLVRMARERKLPSPELTGDMLDEAARSCGEEPPRIDTPTLHRLLDPVEFIRTHCNTGGPAPSETERMLRRRTEQIAEARQRQVERTRRIQEGNDLLQEEIAAICG